MARKKIFKKNEKSFVNIIYTIICFLKPKPNFLNKTENDFPDFDNNRKIISSQIKNRQLNLANLHSYQKLAMT